MRAWGLLLRAPKARSGLVVGDGIIKRTLFAGLIFFLVVVSADAGDSAGKKVIEGAFHVVEGALEVPVQAAKATKLIGNVAETTVDIFKGVFKGLGKTLEGVHDIVAVPLSSKAGDVAAALNPEAALVKEIVK